MIVCKCLQSNFSSIIFIDAPGGTGKAFVTNFILAKVKGDGDVAIAVTLSGIAATLMFGGKTAHSRFKISITVSENTVCNIETSSNITNLLSYVRLLSGMKAPVIRRKSFESIDWTLFSM